MSHIRALSASALLGLLPAVFTPAQAHPLAYPDTGVAGDHFQTALNVSHGCDGSPTVAITLKVPPSVILIKPQWKAGWALTIKKGKLETPRAGLHGKSITERVEEITWRGGPLPNEAYDTFGLQLVLPDTPGETLWLPIIQECQKGAHRWLDIPGPGQAWRGMHAPPPFVKIVPKAP